MKTRTTGPWKPQPAVHQQPSLAVRAWAGGLYEHRQPRVRSARPGGRSAGDERGAHRSRWRRRSSPPHQPAELTLQASYQPRGGRSAGGVPKSEVLSRSGTPCAARQPWSGHLYRRARVSASPVGFRGRGGPGALATHHRGGRRDAGLSERALEQHILQVKRTATGESGAGSTEDSRLPGTWSIDRRSYFR